MKRVILTEAKLKKLMVEIKFNQDIVFVSYLPEKFNLNNFRNVEAFPVYNKPSGGLWACPIDSNLGWKEYTKTRPSLNVDNLYAFYFKLKPNAKIYSIDTFEDLEKISNVPYNYFERYKTARRMNLEWLISNGYDGIYVSENAVKTLEGFIETVDGNKYINGYPTKYGDIHTILGTNGMMGLYDWSVESICIFNPDVIVPISEGDADDINYNKFGDVEYTPEKGLKSQSWDYDDDYYEYDYNTDTERTIDDDEEIQKKASWDLLDAYRAMNYKKPPTNVYMKAKKVDDINKAWKEHDDQEKKRKTADKRSMTNTLKAADNRPLIQKKQ